MSYLKILVKGLFIIYIGIGSISCENLQETRQPISIYLRDKPLSVIQSYIDGKWNLKYDYGGLFGEKYIDTDNAYIIFSPNHIIIGDDIRGIITDTILIWTRIKIHDDSIYVYSHPNKYNSPIIYSIVEEIKSDTLIISDYLMDGYGHYYTR